MTFSHTFWFERLYTRLRLPFWAGALIFGDVIFLALLAASYAVANAWGNFISGVIFFASFPLLLGILPQFATRRVCREMEALGQYFQSMSSEGSKIDLRSLYSFRSMVPAWVIIVGVFNPLYIISASPELSLFQRLFTNLFPWVYMQLFFATFVWVWAYSLFSIYKMGKLPLKLTSFSEDRTLGLKPFARTTLVLTAIYLGFLALLILPQALVQTLPFGYLFVSLGLLALSLGFFLLPLLSLHRKLVVGKEEELRWVNTRYRRIVNQLKASDDDPLNDKLVTQLTAVKELQRDIAQIRTWPFETGMFVRLITVVLTVVGILLARIVYTYLIPF